MSFVAQPVLSQNSQQLETDKLSMPISNCVALNVYSSTKPHNLKIYLRTIGKFQYLVT